MENLNAINNCPLLKHLQVEQVIGEHLNDRAELRRRRSHDPDHLPGSSAANFCSAQRQLSHHVFQDEVLKACSKLQDNNEHQSLLNIDQVPASSNNFHHLIDETTQHYGSNAKFRLTSVDDPSMMIGSHNRIANLSPTPPSITSFRTPKGVDYGVPTKSSKTKPRCWLLGAAYWWLFSPSNMACFARLAGITAAVLSAFFSAVNYAISEYLEENFDPVEVFAWRQTLLIFYCFPVAAYYQKPMYFKRHELKLWWPMLLRSVGSSLAILLIYEAIEYIPLSDATVVSNAAPIFCSIFARIILKEKFGAAEILCAIAVICGVTLNAQPTWLFDFSLLTTGLQNRLIGLALALGGAIATAFTTVIMRTMKSVHFSSQQLMFSYLSTIITWPFVFFMGVARWPPCGIDQKLIVLAIGFTALPAQALLIYACQNEKAGVVSIARSTMPFFALVFQITFFGIFPDLYSIIGNVIILSAIMVLAVKMLRENKQQAAKNLAASNIVADVGVDDGEDVENENSAGSNSDSKAAEEREGYDRMPSPQFNAYQNVASNHQYVQLFSKVNDNDTMFSPESTITSTMSVVVALQHPTTLETNKAV